MKWTRTLPLLALAAFAACDTPDPVNPALDAESLIAEARNPKAACRPTAQLANVTTGTISTGDCVFENAGVVQYEDLFLVNQNKLGQPDRSGATMLTFTGEAPFNAIFGLGRVDQGSPSPVYAFTRFNAGQTGTFRNSFSVVGSSAQYKLWFGGQAPDQLGSYLLTTSVNPTKDTCESGHFVFVEGRVSFDSEIAEGASSCDGFVEVGPFIGTPLNYQYWYVKLLPGQTVEARLTGNTEATTALLAADFGSSKTDLDLGQGPGDTDRSVRLTNERTSERYIYLEVSSVDGTATTYTLSIDAR